MTQIFNEPSAIQDFEIKMEKSNVKTTNENANSPVDREQRE
jgi:hypothetical protein